MRSSKVLIEFMTVVKSPATTYYIFSFWELKNNQGFKEK